MLAATTTAIVMVVGAIFIWLWQLPSPGASQRATGPPSSPAPLRSQITVGAANFPESALLAEIYAQALEAKGFQITRKYGIGNRETYYGQVESGAIDVMPEYNGALASYISGPDLDASGSISTEEINDLLRRKLPSTLEILKTAKAENKDSVTVTEQTAKRYELRSITDLKKVAMDFVMGGPPEFQARHQGMIGLKAKYQLHFKSFQPFRTDDQSTLVQWLKNDQIQAANIFTTDPAITLNKFVVLADPQHVFSAQNITPLVYKSAVNDQAKAALNAVSAKLTTQDLLFMNTRVTVDKVPAATVAKGWLTSTGVLN